MRYWLHRISHHAEISWPLLQEKGLLTIGFADLSNPAFLKKAMAAHKVKDWNDDVRRAYNGKLIRPRFNLWRFLRAMSVGDRVLVPGLRGSGTYSVWNIDGPPRVVSKAEIPEGVDLGFCRDVSVHRVGNVEAKEISRYDYADSALTARMKTRGTNVEITDIKKSLKKALAAFSEQKPLRLYSWAINDGAEGLLEEIHRGLNPDKFEALIKWYFERLGASAEISSKNQRGEGDVDIVASLDRLRLTIYVQAKFHKTDSETDDWAVRQVDDYAQWADEQQVFPDEHIVARWVVSTCRDFTDNCRTTAEKAGVILVNGIEFARMLLDAGLERLDL